MQIHENNINEYLKSLWSRYANKDIAMKYVLINHSYLFIFILKYY